MSKDSFIDPTTDNKWLIKHSDRMIEYECNLRLSGNVTSEMFPDEIADKIGRPKEYVASLIKNAISHAKACYHQRSSISENHARNHDAARINVR